MNYPPIGTVSEGTMRPEDLIPAFVDVLEEYAPERLFEIRTDPDYEEIIRWLDGNMPDGDEDLPESASWFVGQLFDELNEIAAPFTSFGASEGDGADYGFWPDIEGLAEAARYHDGVVKVNGGDNWEYDCTSILIGSGRMVQCVGTDIDYVMSVSDHGNVTLYDARTREEIWSCV